MSWQAYVDNLINSGKIDKAALYSRAGDSVWATSKDFQLSASEVLNISKGFDDPSALQEKGLYAEDVKYFLLRCDGRTMHGKQGDSGIIIVRTNQALVVGHYSPPTVAGEAMNVIEAMADYLVKANY